MLRMILVVMAMVVVTLAGARPLLPSARSVHTAAFEGHQSDSHYTGEEMMLREAT